MVREPPPPGTVPDPDDVVLPLFTVIFIVDPPHGESMFDTMTLVTFVVVKPYVVEAPVVSQRATALFPDPTVLDASGRLDASPEEISHVAAISARPPIAAASFLTSSSSDETPRPPWERGPRCLLFPQPWIPSR